MRGKIKLLYIILVISFNIVYEKNRDVNSFVCKFLSMEIEGSVWKYFDLVILDKCGFLVFFIEKILYY